MGPSLPRRLLLEGTERSKLTLSGNDLFHGGGTEGADQLVLQIRDAHVETQSFQIGASEVGAEACPLETAPEVALLSGVAETRQPDVKPPRAEQIQASSYGLRAPNWHNGNALSVKIPTTPLSERLERHLVADPFNEHHRAHVGACGRRICCGTTWSSATAGRSLDVCRGKWLLLVHIPHLHSSHAPHPWPIRTPSDTLAPTSVSRAVRNRRLKQSSARRG